MASYNISKLTSNIAKLTGNDNWHFWLVDVEMVVRAADEAMWGIITGTATSPTDATALAIYNKKNADGFLILWNSIHTEAVGIKHDTLKGIRTASAAWIALKDAFQKDVRSQRFTLRRRFNNPEHDTSKPVSEYINAIVHAADALAAIGHPPKPVEITDMIIMHLDPGWHVAQTTLTARSTEPPLASVKALLIEQEMLAESRGDSKLTSASDAHDSALKANASRKDYSKSRNGNRKRRDVQSDQSDGESDVFSWGNPQSDDACFRCGKPGHIAATCMYKMPDWRCKEILEQRRKHADGRSSASRSRAEIAGLARLATVAAHEDIVDLDALDSDDEEYEYSSDSDDEQSGTALRATPSSTMEARIMSLERHAAGRRLGL